MTKILKNFSFEPDFIHKLEILKRQTNHTNLTAVIIQAVMSLYEKKNPTYKPAFEHKNLSPQEKASIAVKEEINKKKEIENKQLEIAAALEGEIYTEGSEKRVKFYNYFENHRSLVDYSLDEITADMVVDQYLPNKEDVLRRRSEGKCKY